jgi:hypothetical protein
MPQLSDRLGERRDWVYLSAIELEEQFDESGVGFPVPSIQRAADVIAAHFWAIESAKTRSTGFSQHTCWSTA